MLTDFWLGLMAGAVLGSLISLAWIVAGNSGDDKK
jgi:hypothetical protein